jgi:hypothetical protein
VPRIALSRNQTLALIAITLILHTAEEYVAFPLSLSSLGRQLPWWLPAPALRHSMTNLHIALIAGAVLPSLVIVWAIISRSHGFLIASLFVEAILLVNAFAHMLTAILKFGYVPGLITAVLINLPFGIYVFRRAVSERWIRNYRAWQLLAAALVVHVIWIYSGVIRKAPDQRSAIEYGFSQQPSRLL